MGQSHVAGSFSSHVAWAALQLPDAGFLTPSLTPGACVSIFLFLQCWDMKPMDHVGPHRPKLYLPPPNPWTPHCTESASWALCPRPAGICQMTLAPVALVYPPGGPWQHLPCQPPQCQRQCPRAPAEWSRRPQTSSSSGVPQRSRISLAGPLKQTPTSMRLCWTACGNVATSSPTASALWKSRLCSPNGCKLWITIITLEMPTGPRTSCGSWTRS